MCTEKNKIFFVPVLTDAGTPGGCAGCFISLEKVNKDLTFKSYTRKI